MSVIKHRPTRAKVTIICTRNDQVLLVRRKGAKWKFPNGLLERGE
ncbi:TPA: NUDIX domain-containing protein [Pseudomonas putida]